MNHLTHLPRRRNVRAFIAAFISYIMLAGQIAPLALAAPAPRPATKSEAAANAITPQPAAAAPVPQSLVAAVGPVITATKVDAFPSHPSGKANPGDVIDYTVTITNTGTGDATGVTFSDSVDTNTTLVAGSITTTPIANPESVSAFGNVRISTANGAPNLLANDCDPDPAGGPCTNAGLTASGPTTSTQGGNVVVNSDGTFSYNPAPGFTGSDTFTYTASDAGGKTDTATVTITVGPTLIWFINNSAASGGDGRITSPFNSIAAYNASAPTKDPNDIVFIFQGASAYPGNLTLVSGMKLIGQGFTLQTETGTPPAGSDPLPAATANPIINSASGNTVTLNTNNTIRGLTLNDSAGIDLTGSTFGTLTVSNVTLSGTGRPLNLVTGALAVTFDQITSTSASGGQGINLAGLTGTMAVTNGTSITNPTTQCILVGTTTANINFGNTTCSGGTDGVSFQNNSAGTRTFGTLSVSGGSGVAFLSGAGGGNVTVTGAASLASTGNPVDIQNMANGTAISFAGTTVSKTTAGGAGINWGGTNTGATLGFASLALTTSNGPGLVATGGGTINVTTGSISSTGSAGQAAPAINSSGVTLGATFTSVSSTSSGNSGNGINLTNTPGTLTINGGSISGAAGDAFVVSGVTTSTANITYNGTISTSTARPVNISGKTAGTVAFGGAISSTSNGVLLNSNTGATINFTGGLNLSTGANAAFTATAGGTVSATQNNTTIVNTLTTTTGTALNVTSTTIGASGLTFRSITSNGAGTADGIILNATGATAGLTITANGGTCTSAATCTGGTISNKTGADLSTTQGTGIFLSSTVGVSLDRMQLNDFQNHAIYGTNVTGFSLTNSNITGTNGTSAAGGSREGDVHFDNLFTSASFPTAAITNCVLGGTSFSDILRVFNTSGTLNRLVVSNTTFGLVGSGGNDGMVAAAFNNGTVMNVTLQDSVLTNAIGSDLRVNANNNSIVDMVVRRNKFSNNNVNFSSGGGLLSFQGGGTGTNATQTYDISCNRFQDAIGIAVLVAHNGGTGTSTGSIVNNVVGVAGSATLTGSTQASGIKLAISGSSGTHTTMIANNDVRRTNEEGIFIQNNNGTATVNASVFGNIVAEPGSFSFAGLNVDIGAGVAGDASKINIVVGSATVTAQKNDFSNGDPSNFSDVNFSLNTPAGGFINLSRNGSAGGTVAQVIDDDNLNPATTNTSVSGTVTLVNTLPITPPAVASCTLPAGPVTFDGDTVTGPGGISTQAGNVQSAPTTTTGMNGGVTSRPFVSPRPLAPRAVAPTTTAARTAAPTNTTQADTTRAGTTTRTTTDPVVINGAGGTVSIIIGTLRAGDSVTITFQVTIDNPYSGGPNVSNQGTVSGSNFSNVLTDDPDVAGAANPTLTPVDSLNMFARDAKAAEPATGTAPMLFTIALSAPATGAVSVNFATADGGATPATGGASCGTAGVDYVATSGTINFATGERLKTVPVTICSDAVADDNETLLLNLSGATGATIQDNQAVGTITANVPGTFIISELRTSGPGGAGDDFVEMYNNTNTPLTVAASDASAGFGLFKMGADCNATPVLIATIPNGTVIPARGHFLAVGSQYSLANYGGTGAAAGNVTMTSDIESDRNVAIFSTADVANISSAARHDAVGFGTNTGGGVCDLLREGATLAPVSGTTTEHSYFRKECDFVGGVGCAAQGNPKETNDNAADFKFADTQGTFISGVVQQLGAPGPENVASPIRRDNTGIGLTLLDNTKSAAVAPNRVRDFTSNPGNNSTFGTLSIRRRVVNSTGGNVTRLRFRIIEMTTFPSPGGGIADLRAISSTSVSVSGVGDAGTCGASPTPCTVTVQGTTLEQPPNQPNGGGLNSTMAAGTVTLGTPLANGASLNVQFLLGIQTTGTFRFLLIIEALP